MTIPVITAIKRRGSTPAERHIRGERRADDAFQIRERLRHCGRVCLRVQGSSMLPWMRPGDVVLISRSSQDSVRCGDVVLYASDQRLFVHRLIEKRGGWLESSFLAKGDAHPLPDGVLTGDDILGRIVRIYRRGRRIDLDSPVQLALGILISQISSRTRAGSTVVRWAAHLTRPIRRILVALRPSGAAIR